MGLDENMAGKKIVIYIELNPDNAVLLKKNIDFQYKIIDFMILFTKQYIH